MSRSSGQVLLAEQAQPDSHDVIFVPSSPALPPTRPRQTDTPSSLSVRNRTDTFLLPPRACPSHDVVVVDSTPDAIARALENTETFAGGGTETKSRYFATQRSSPRDERRAGATNSASVSVNVAELPTLSPQRYVSGDLEQAMRRRCDWTPPPRDAAVILNSDSSDACEAWSSSPSRIARQSSIFKTLHDSFGCKTTEEKPDSGNVAANNEAFTSRKPLEAVSIGDAESSVKRTSQAKAKATKKKPRTITELAVAAYATPSMSDEATSTKKTARPTLQVEATDTAADPPVGAECKPGQPYSKLRKLKKPTTTTKKPKTKKATKSRPRRPRQPALLSPRSALQDSMGQNFLFGTSSQLAREESPTFLRELHTAMQSSNQEDDSFLSLFTGASTVDLTADTATPKTRLWAVGARGDGGDLALDNIVELDGDIEFPEDPHQVIAMAQRAAEEAAGTKPKPAVEESTAEKGSSQPLMQRPSAERNKILSSTQVPDSKKRQPQRLAESSLLSSVDSESAGHRPASAGVQQARPNYDVLTTAQLAQKVSSYGYKPIRARKAMIALLEQCWEAKTLPPFGAAAQPSACLSISTKASAAGSRKSASDKATEPSKASTESPAQATAKKRTSTYTQPADRRPAKRKTAASMTSTSLPALASTKPSSATSSAQIHIATEPTEPEARVIFEIEDSESDGRFSSPEVPCSIASGDEDDEVLLTMTQRTDDLGEDEKVDDSNDDLSLAAVVPPTHREATLFRHITKAVLGAPPTTDPANPSWHEKMLMYDTILLEPFTAWLNDDALAAAGYDAARDGVATAFEVKKWCESKSVCCTWRKNLHGKERKL